MQGRITNVSNVDGDPCHPYRVGDIVEIIDVDEVPINDGPGTPERMMKDYLVKRPGDTFSQIVDEYDLEEIDE